MALGAAALTEGCVTISPLASTGGFPVDTGFNLAESTTWERMKSRNNNAGQIVIGVKADQPGLGYFDQSTGTYSGFDILIAEMVAAGLGFSASQIDFVTVASQDRETDLENETVDLVVASYSYTADRAKLVGFAGPYLTTAEALMVAKGNTAITGMSSITPQTRVCEVSNSTSIGDVTLQNPVVMTTYSQCVNALTTHQADVVYTDYSLLVGFEDQDPNGLSIIPTSTTTQYGIGLPLNDVQLKDAIDTILSQSVKDGTWRAIFNATLGPEGFKADAPNVGTWSSAS